MGQGRDLAGEHQRRRVRRQPQHVGDDQPGAGVQGALDGHPLGLGVHPHRERRRARPGAARRVSGITAAGRRCLRAGAGGASRRSRTWSHGPRGAPPRRPRSRVQTCSFLFDPICTNWYNRAHQAGPGLSDEATGAPQKSGGTRLGRQPTSRSVQLLKTLRWWDGFVIALCNPGFLLGSLGFTLGIFGVSGR